MKLSLSWLREYVELPATLSADDLERKLGELSRRVAQLERAATATPPRRGFRRRG